MTDVLTKQQRSRNMAAIKSKHTKPELKVRLLLNKTGFRQRFHDEKLLGRPDIVFPTLKKVIFINGCFWHMHKCKYGQVKPATNSNFWNNKRSGNKLRDIANIKQLRKQGWSVFTVWECQLKNPEKIGIKIFNFLKYYEATELSDK